jgi:hypothetical protein
MAYWRRQAVELTLFPVAPDPPQPLSRAPRARRAHHRLGWQERLHRNARGTPLVAHIHVPGVPTSLARVVGFSHHP